MKIGILVGSLRRESFNRKIALILMQLAAPAIAMEIVEISHLPFYNQDLDTAPPESWVNFRKKIAEFDGILFVSPEYNRSTPPALKNAVDIGSRPYGSSVWNGKPCAVISSSIGGIGGFAANHHLRQSFVFLNMPCLQQPEMYLGHVDKLFDEKGQLNNSEVKQLLENFLQTFKQWVSTHSHAKIS